MKIPKPSLCAVAFSVVSAISFSVQALPLWNDFRTQTEAQRAILQADVHLLLAKVPVTGFTNSRVRFCVRNQEIWETSANASCATTAAAANRHAWPSLATAPTLNFAWVAYARFIAGYCSVHPTETSCAKLVSTSTLRRRIPTWSRLLISNAYAKETVSSASEIFSGSGQEAPAATTPPPAEEICKFENNRLVTKTGQKIFFDFSVQPTEKHTETLTRVATSAADKNVSDSAIADGLTLLNRLGKPILENTAAKSPWVEDLVSKEAITWFGVEQTESELGDRTGEKFARSYDQLKDQLMSRKVSAAVAVDALTIGACPSAAICTWLQNKNLRSTKLLPLAANDLTSQKLDLERKVRASFELLQKNVDDKKLAKDEFDAIRRDYENLLLATDPPDQKARAKARTRYRLPDVSRSLVELYDLATQLKANETLRNRALISSAFAQPGNGILSFALVRRTAILSAIEDHCKGPRKAEEPSEPKSKSRSKSKKKSSRPKRAKTSR